MPYYNKDPNRDPNFDNHPYGYGLEPTWFLAFWEDCGFLAFATNGEAVSYPVIRLPDKLITRNMSSGLGFRV